MANKSKRKPTSNPGVGSGVSAAELRQSFIDYFVARDHTFVRSSPVMPEDASLKFTNAGMNQFKDVFLGTGSRDYTRAVNSQKCIRAGGKHNDLDDVGRDTTHQTFFEMLGNWSFGDYYKAEAIEWAWELLTQEWGLPKDKLYATVYRTDDEAAQLWGKVTDINKDHILRFDEKDNFWEMAATGPCGPCSEIHIDLGEQLPGKRVNDDSPRFVELWNLVFIQNFRNAEGELEPLPATHVDTGMGFERVLSVLQGSNSNYETDCFRPILDAISAKISRPYGEDEATDVAMRVIADHVRCLTVAISDGIRIGRTDRNYVLRSIARRAARFGRQLGLNEPFIHELVPSVVEVLGEAFPEVKQQAETASKAILAEEELFGKTVDRGIKLFGQLDQELPEGAPIPGDKAFELHGTYGFPIDLTAQMGEEVGREVDRDSFERLIEEDRERARKHAGANPNAIAEAIETSQATEFVGYQQTNCSATVLESQTLSIDGGEVQVVVLDRSPFYAESGGQVGDTGTLRAGASEFRVDDTQKSGGVWLHLGELTAGEPLAAGSEVEATIDVERRRRIETHHSGTHLLHWALRAELGETATQQGSLVEPHRLRFDFACDDRLGPEQLARIETAINNKVLADEPVTDQQLSLDEAKAAGAMALFGEKYGDVVRMVSIGEFSKELCGGTHVGRAGEIGGMVITSEGNVQAGVRRVVALAGMDAVRHQQRQRELLGAACRAARADTHEELPGKVEALSRALREAENELAQLRAAAAAATAQDALGAAEQIGELTVVLATVSAGKDELRRMGDEVKKSDDARVGLFVDTSGAKSSYLAVASEAAIKLGVKAGDLLRVAGKAGGGGGGGKPSMAQGGGGDPAKAGAALDAVRAHLAAQAG